MNALLLQTTARLLAVLLAVFSVLVLLRGHNEPGGGFIGGLLCGLALATHAIAFGGAKTRRLVRVDPRTLLGLGLLIALLSGAVALLLDQPFMTGQWLGKVPGIGKIATVLAFDVGVYLVVLGTTLMIVLTLMRRED